MSTPNDVDEAQQQIGEDAPCIYPGLVGEIVNLYEPHSEGSVFATAVQFLVAFGNAVGHNAFVATSSERQHANEFVLVIGDTGNSRKGTSLNPVLEVMEQADPEWAMNLGGGLSSAEGLIEAVKDAVMTTDENGNDVVVVEGVVDKRLLAIETEFASVLTNFLRLGNVLSPAVRKAFDGGTLRVRTRKSPLKATNPHISIIGHTTPADLLKHLSSTEAANGFANRFLVVPAHRNGVKAFPGEPSRPEVAKLAEKVAKRISQALFVGEVPFDAEAVNLWKKVYPSLSDVPLGFVGELTARNHSHVLRLALIYSLINFESGSPRVTEDHILSAMSVVEICTNTVEKLFGDVTGNKIADMIIDGLEVGDEVTKTGLRDRRIVPANVRGLNEALRLLQELGRIDVHTGPQPDVGRPPTIIVRVR